MMKLKNMISPVDGFFTKFSELYEEKYTELFSAYQAQNLDVKFYSENGEKAISPILLYYSVNDSISDDNFVSVCEMLWETNIENWTRLAEIFTLDYDVVNPYNITDTTVLSSSTKTTNEDVTTTDSDIYGFNSDSPVNDSDKTDSSTGNSEKEIAETKTYTRKGNIGNTAYQDFINKELELRKTKFIDCVFADIARFATLPIYE